MDLSRLKIGEKAPEKINVVIETVRGSRAKYELKHGYLMLDKFIKKGLQFPADYGFIPQTRWDDGDAMDVILLSSIDNPPLTVVQARPIALLKLKDKGVSDDKIIAVPADDPEYKSVKDLDDLTETIREQIMEFMMNYKAEAVEIHDFLGAERALKAIRHGNKLYKTRIEG